MTKSQWEQNPHDSETALENVLKEGGLPPFTKKQRKLRAEVYRYYNLTFNSKGIPGKINKGEFVEHPIYGSYLIKEYLNMFKRENDSTYKKTALKLGKTIIERMDDSNNMLRYWYEPEWGLGTHNERYISGLTQSHYLAILAQMKEFGYTHQKLLNVLSTPIDQGGIAEKTEHGWIIEEEPNRPIDLVLNGWLTCLSNIHTFIRIQPDSTQARELLGENLKTLSKLLQYYDSEKHLNSRYRIRGFAYLRIRFQSEFISQCNPTGKVYIPCDGEYTINTKKQPNRWENSVIRGFESINSRNTIKNEMLINVVLSKISGERPNTVTLEFDSNLDNEASVELADGDYDPLLTGMKTQRWIHIKNQKIKKGRNRIDIEIKPKLLETIVYPTNFKKRINDQNYNSYHWVHIKQLDILGEAYDIKELKHYRDKWMQYAKKWKCIPEYAEKEISLLPHHSVSEKISKFLI